ncbi:hypothetical protein [Streptomyces sp. NPDC060027]|uniref:hypothetical protein n=1 Tax=Streptomyces sp. NPDC060027 TaxID=3347040 RepID=UPI0036CF785A
MRTWPALPLAELLKLAEAGTRPGGRRITGMQAEGYVIRWPGGLRAKAKLAEYVRLHKVLTGITERDIWRCLGIQKFAGQPPKPVAKALDCPVTEVTALGADGKGPPAALLEQVPEEFDAWVRSVAARLERDASAAEAAVGDGGRRLAHLGATVGNSPAARAIGDPGVRAAMFLLLDGKPLDTCGGRSGRRPPRRSSPTTNDHGTGRPASTTRVEGRCRCRTAPVPAACGEAAAGTGRGASTSA